MKKQRYTVPTHMNVPDKVLFGLTVRQVLTLLSGLALSYQCWQVLRFTDTFGTIGLSVRIAVSVLPALISLVVAFVVVAERPLEIWALVWLRYSPLPKTYTWQSAKEAQGVQAQEKALMRSAFKRRQEVLTRGGEHG